MALLEKRRRTTTTTTTSLTVQNGVENHDSQAPHPTNKNRPRRKKKRSARLSWRRLLLRSRRRAATWRLLSDDDDSKKISTLGIALLAAVALLFFFVSKQTIMFFFRSQNGVSFSGTTAAFRREYHERNDLIQQNIELYDATYKLSSERLLPPDETAWREYERRPFELKPTYGDAIIETPCEVTILVTDPRLAFPKYLGGPGQPIWFALESLGAFAPKNACVLLQTSTCAMDEYLGDDTSHDEVLKAIAQTVYDNSLPLFRRMIESGSVRLTILDHVKYNLMGCMDFGNPSPAYMNRWFWEDEFIQGVDSDLVLVFQSDTALCYPLDVSNLREYAFIGGVWPKKATPLTPDPMEGSCLGMPLRWKNWLLPQRRWKMQQSNIAGGSKGKTIHAVEPKEKLPEDFPNVCEDGRAPVGNGGLSLRSRQWMVQAIETCPHVANSGMNLTDQPLACKVFEQVNEDFYFGTILAGLNAPLPSAYTASLFSTEMLWPEQVWEMYGLPQDVARDLRGSIVTGNPFVWLEGQKLTIPNGLHKPWWYHPNDLTRSDAVAKGCIFSQYIFTPEMSRWEDMNKDNKPWVGVGS